MKLWTSDLTRETDSQESVSGRMVHSFSRQAWREDHARQVLLHIPASFWKDLKRKEGIAVFRGLRKLQPIVLQTITYSNCIAGRCLKLARSVTDVDAESSSHIIEQLILRSRHLQPRMTNGMQSRVHVHTCIPGAHHREAEVWLASIDKEPSPSQSPWAMNLGTFFQRFLLSVDQDMYLRVVFLKGLTTLRKWLPPAMRTIGSCRFEMVTTASRSEWRHNGGAASLSWVPNSLNGGC